MIAIRRLVDAVLLVSLALVASNASAQFLPGPQTCPTLPYQTPYDVSGVHVWEVVPNLGPDQTFKRVLNSCGDAQADFDGEWPRDVIVPPDQYQIALALESVDIVGDTATLSYAGTLTFKTTNAGFCDTRPNNCPGFGVIGPTWRGQELQILNGTLTMVWRFNTNGTWTLVTSGTEFLSDQRFGEPDFCSQYLRGPIIRMNRNLQAADQCSWIMRNQTIPINEIPPTCVTEDEFMQAQNPALCPSDRLQPHSQGVEAYIFFRDNLPILPGGKFALDAPKGEIVVQLDSNQNVMTPSGVQVERARLVLSPQGAYIRDRNPGETDEEYDAYLATVPLGQPLEVTLEPGDAGVHRYEALSTFLLRPTANTQTYTPVYYTLQVLGAESSELPVGMGTENTTVFFTNEVRRNLRARDMPQTLTIQLDSFDQIIRKEALVVALTKLGPEQYQAIEEQVQQHLNQVKVTRTPEQLEGIDRAILAEQLTRDSVRFAEQQIDVLLMGFQSFLDDLIDSLGSENKVLAEQREKLDNLTGALEFELLQNQGWKGFVSGDSSTSDALLNHISELISSDADLGISLMAEFLKKGVDTAYGLMKQALESAQLTNENALLLADFIKARFDSALELAISQGFGGSKPTTKFLVAQIIQATKASLVDSIAPWSFTALTSSSLDASRQLMEGWNVDDRAQFETDRRAFRALDNEMAQAVFVTSNGVTSYTTAISDAFGGLGAEIIGVLGPFGRATKKVMDGVKFLSNYLTFSVPFVTTYGVIAGPDVDLDLSLAFPFGDSTVRLGLLDRGIKAAYGVSALPGVSKSALQNLPAPGLAPGPGKGLSVTAGYLDAALTARRDAVVAVLDEISTALADDRLIDAVAAASEVDGTSLIELLPAFRDAVEHTIQYQQGTVAGDDAVFARLSQVIEGSSNLVLSYADLLSRLQQVVFSVLNLEYSGPDSALYQAERDYVLAGIDDLTGAIQALSNAASQSLSQLPDMPLSPAVVVSRLTIESATTGEDTLSQNTENFTVSATLRNLGADPVNDLSAEMSVTSVGDTVTLVSSASMSPAGATLAANDGVDGSGSDEATLQWTVAYAGDVTVEQRAVLSVDLKENNNAPGSFRPYAASAILRPDIAATDGDLDGMPTAWEMDNGLNPGLDDADDDADNDGLNNSDEFNAGTNPQVQDSDGDNLFDGEEASAGSDGFVTDPTVADTDGDGSNDDIDGSPLDASTTAAPAAGELPGEPVVAVGPAMVVLNDSRRAAAVTVSNSGEGILNWTAVPGNPALISVSPGALEIRSRDGALLISIAPSLDLGTETLQTSVTVLDVTGTTKDSQVITVVLGDPPDTLFADGFEGP